MLFGWSTASVCCEIAFVLRLQNVKNGCVDWLVAPSRFVTRNVRTWVRVCTHSRAAIAARRIHTTKQICLLEGKRRSEFHLVYIVFLVPNRSSVENVVQAMFIGLKSHWMEKSTTIKIRETILSPFILISSSVRFCLHISIVCELKKNRCFCLYYESLA